MRKNLRVEDITAIIDTREQTPLDLSPIKSERAALATGDYSIKGLEDYISIERKSLSDLVGCIGNDRSRFERELMRLKAYETRAVVVEANWSDLVEGRWKSKLKPRSATGSVLSWIEFGIPFLFVGDHAGAADAVSRLLWFSANRRFRMLRSISAAD